MAFHPAPRPADPYERQVQRAQYVWSQLAPYQQQGPRKGSDRALRTGLDMLRTSGTQAQTADPLVAAARSFATQLAKDTKMTVDHVVMTLSNPELRTDRTIRTAAKMLCDSDPQLEGTRPNDIGRVARSMSFAVNLEIRTIMEAARRAIDEVTQTRLAGQHPPLKRNVPDGAWIGQAAVFAGLSSLETVRLECLQANVNNTLSSPRTTAHSQRASDDGRRSRTSGRATDTTHGRT